MVQAKLPAVISHLIHALQGLMVSALLCGSPVAPDISRFTGQVIVQGFIVPHVVLVFWAHHLNSMFIVANPVPHFIIARWTLVFGLILSDRTTARRTCPSEALKNPLFPSAKMHGGGRSTYAEAGIASLIPPRPYMGSAKTSCAASTMAWNPHKVARFSMAIYPIGQYDQREWAENLLTVEHEERRCEKRSGEGTTIFRNEE